MCHCATEVKHDRAATKRAEVPEAFQQTGQKWKQTASEALAGAKSWCAGKNLTGVPAAKRARHTIDEVWSTIVQQETEAMKLKQSPPSTRKISKKQSSKVLLAEKIDLPKLAENSFVDFSQNKERGVYGKGTKTLTSKTELYSYERDRVIIPKEHFRMLMHARQNFGSLSDHQIRDLAGHSLSMPNATLCTLSLILAADLNGFWQYPQNAMAFAR